MEPAFRKKIRRWKNEALFHCEKSEGLLFHFLIFLLVGVVSMLTRGFNLGIDFTGGSIIDVKFENPVTVSEVRDVLSDHKLGSSIIQLGSMDGQQTEESQSVLIRTGIISDDQRVETMTDMTNRLGPNEVLRVENVGATVGRDLVKSAMGAVALSWVLMIIYITIRFEHNFAFAAIIALIIDVMVTLSWFSLLQLEMDSSFVAALLTVVGYSINGTIVIFDRIRENLHTHRRSESLGDMVDNSIWQTMNRSIYTSRRPFLPSLPSSCLVGRRFGTFLLLCLLALAVGSIRRLPGWSLVDQAAQPRHSQINES